MDWLKKLAGYAPDIAGAILSGGATLPATAIRIASKELLGYETDDKNLLAQTVADATPEDMLKLKQAENDFKIAKLQIEAQETRDLLADTQHAREQHAHNPMPAIICCFLSVCLVAFGGCLMFVEVPEANQRIIDTLFGSYLTAWLSSIAYWVGSSRGSAEKDRRKT